jgi:hypothetical protein
MTLGSSVSLKLHSLTMLRVIIYKRHLLIEQAISLHLQYLTRLQRLTKDKFKFLTTLRFYLLQTRQLNKGQSINYKREKGFITEIFFHFKKHLKEVEEKQQSSDLLTRAGILARERARKRESERKRERRREREGEREREREEEIERVKEKERERASEKEGERGKEREREREREQKWGKRVRKNKR